MFICSASSPRLCTPQKELLEGIRGTSTVPPCGYSVNIWGNHTHLNHLESKKKKIKLKQKTNNKKNSLREQRLGLIS